MAHSALVPGVEAGHDLDRAEDTLVVSVQDTAERGEEGETERSSVVEQTAPTCLAVHRDHGVHVASCCCSAAAHDASCLWW